MVRLAVLVRNQCRCVIKYHLAESPDVRATGEVWLRRELAPRCSVFVDVGANVGEWLDAVVECKGAHAYRALAIEPSSSAFAVLSERYAGNPRVETINCALGDAEGTVNFFEEERAGKGSSIVAGFSRAAGFERTVNLTTLDRLAEARGLTEIDLLKIDAEGYDLRVLRGASALLEGRRIGVAQFEYNRSWQLAGDTLFAAMTLLGKYGYEVFVLKREGLFTLNYQRYEEYFEYSNFVAVSPRFSETLKPYYRGEI